MGFSRLSAMFGGGDTSAQEDMSPGSDGSSLFGSTRGLGSSALFGSPSHAPPARSRFEFAQSPPNSRPAVATQHPGAPSTSPRPSSSVVSTPTNTSLSGVPGLQQASLAQEWQDGLRAMFPGVNVSFAGQPRGGLGYVWQLCLWLPLSSPMHGMHGSTLGK